MRFGVVGGISTATDVILLNIFFSYAHLPLILANILSASAATLFNYFGHKKWTFQTKEDLKRKNHFLAYVLVTVSSLYVLQSGLLYVFKEVWHLPVHLVGSALTSLHVVSYVSDELALNIAKFFSLCVGAAYNFVMYREFVFKEKTPPSQKDDA